MYFQIILKLFFMYIIYGIEIKGAIKYVGASKDIFNRLKCHFSSTTYPCGGIPLYKDMNMNLNTVRFVVIDYCTARTVDKTEKKWISHYNKVNGVYNRVSAEGLIKGLKSPVGKSVKMCLKNRKQLKTIMVDNLLYQLENILPNKKFIKY